jgi:hypothetical protein
MKREIPQPSYPYKAAKHWSMRAEEMRTLAEEANNPALRQMMLRLSADYDRFARRAGDRASEGSIMFRVAMRAESRPDAQALDVLPDDQEALAEAG